MCPTTAVCATSTALCLNEPTNIILCLVFHMGSVMSDNRNNGVLYCILYVYKSQQITLAVIVMSIDNVYITSSTARASLALFIHWSLSLWLYLQIN